MEVRSACLGSPEAAVNEDFAVVAPDFVAVLDGVTVPEGLDTGCMHGPAWYVRRLGARLIAGHTKAPRRPLADLLAEAITGTRDDHAGRCDLGHPHSPQSTVCLLRGGAHSADYLVLSDSALVTERGNRLDVVTDLRHRRVGGPAAARPPGAEPARYGRAERLNALVAKRRHANQPGGYWVAAADPEPAYHAITGTLPLTGPESLTRAALLTDGASCAVDYGLTDWRGLLDILEHRGPHHLISLVREAERADPDRERLRRYKRHDDATAVFCRVHP